MNPTQIQDALDLDDGVKVNYSKFGDLLSKTKAVTGKKYNAMPFSIQKLIRSPESKIEARDTRHHFSAYLLEIKRFIAVKTPATEQVAEQVTEQVVRLLFSPKNQQLSACELMDQLALKHRPTFLYDYLKPALENGLIKMTRPDAPRSPAQRYRLNPKGRRFIER